MGFNPFEQIGSAAADAGKFLQDRGNDIAKVASEGANAVAKGAAEGADAVVKAASEGADAVAKAASEGAEAAAKAVTSGTNQVAEAAASIGKAPIWHQANHAITEDDDDLAAVFVDSSFDELKDKSEEQRAEAQKFLIDFMKKIIRLKGVRIDSTFVCGRTPWRCCDGGYHPCGHHAILRSCFQGHAEACIPLWMAVISR